MAYPEHWLFSFGGAILGGVDVWSNNVRFANDDGSIPINTDEGDILEGLMSDLQARFVADAGSTGLGYSSAVDLRWGKFNKIGPDGRYASATETHVLDLPAPVPGLQTPAASIPQVALAVSWGTGRARGPASRGRIYVPMPQQVPQLTTGRLTAAQTAKAADNWAALLQEWGDEPGIDMSGLVPSVVSSVGTGAAEPITRVRVGDVLDTMRSRRNAMEEVYSTATVGGL